MSFDGEHLELAAFRELHQAATPELASNLGLQTLEIGGAFVSIAAALPPSAIVVNRAIGLGIDEPAREESVVKMVQTYRDAGVDRYFIQRHPDATPPVLTGWLLDNGLEKARGWQKFSRGREPVPEITTDLRIERVGPEYGPALARIVCAAFDLGEEAEPWLALWPGLPNWHAFMSFEGEEPAGCGGLFIQDGMAWTDFGATAPAFRQRGSQGAVLAARLRFALERGCHTIMTCTGEDVPRDPQHSYRNILKLGFREDYVRENYAPPRG